MLVKRLRALKQTFDRSADLLSLNVDNPGDRESERSSGSHGSSSRSSKKRNNKKGSTRSRSRDSKQSSSSGRRRKRSKGSDAPWWYDIVTTAIRSPVVDNQHAIFTNRTLRFEKIQAVGFDFDHTLAIYNTERLDGLAMRLVVDRMIEHEGIDASWFSDLPGLSFARKGLIVDIELGNVLKTDRYGHVLHAFHGAHKLTTREKREAYGEADVIPHVTEGMRYLQMDSAFAKPETCIYSGIAPRVDAGQYRKLWKKIRKHTDIVHRDGSLKSVITASPRDYLQLDPHTEPLLRWLKSIGKKVFLLTNSEWEYTCAMMNPTLGRLGGADDLSWLELFDVVVAEGRKPGYFKRVNPAPAGEPGPESNVVCAGNILELEERLETGGPQVLYVGDHIYADLISSKRNTYWRTMLVVPELEEELTVQSALPGMVQQLKETDERRTITEREVMHWKSIEAALRRIDDSKNSQLLGRLKEECRSSRQGAMKALNQFIRQRERLRSRLSTATNAHWGSLFRAGNELTYYGRQLEDFACTYTSRATNLSFYPPNHYFRSAMDYLPHELESV